MTIQAGRMLQLLRPATVSARPPNDSIDSFGFRHFPADRNSAKPRSFPAVTWATTFGTALALRRDAMLRVNCEAVMWRITTRGFTLGEVLIMAAMNLKASGDSAGKREKRASQK
jgi:hypothetical protein